MQQGRLSSTVSRMCGLASLPDEIVGEILFHAAVNNSGLIVVNNSLRLSHVNQRLRRLALATGDLWTNIAAASCHSTTPIKTFVARSGDRLLDVTYTSDLSSPSREERLLDFIACVAPVAHRWQRFELRFEYGPCPELGEKKIVGLSRVFSTLNKLSLPNLRRLAINHKIPGSYAPHARADPER